MKNSIEAVHQSERFKDCVQTPEIHESSLTKKHKETSNSFK